MHTNDVGELMEPVLLPSPPDPASLPGDGGYREHAPSPPLRDLVACFWTRSSAQGAQRVLPDGAMDLLFVRGDDGGFQGHVVGVMTRALVTQASPGAFVGVRFHPGEACRLFSFPAADATDRFLCLDDLWGPCARELAAILDQARGSVAQVRALDAALVRRLPRVAPADFRLRSAVRALRGGAPHVAQVAADLGLSPRQLHRLFDARVGVGPKLLARVLRLQRALAGHVGGEGTWAALAHAAGYADQAHFVRDCRALTGVAPGVLGRGASDSFNPGDREIGTKA